MQAIVDDFSALRIAFSRYALSEKAGRRACIFSGDYQIYNKITSRIRTVILDRHNRLNLAELYASLQGAGDGESPATAAPEAQKSPATADEKSAQKSSIKSETPHLPPDQMDEFVNMMQVYEGAMYEISTKLEILDSEFQVRFSHDPIHHMERRLKSVHSIFEKLQRRHLDISTRSIRDNLFDVAGIRVICNYRDDVYSVAQYLSKQTDIQVLQVKDYIKNPKQNGYRSLHVIYAVPVFLSSGAHYTPVEVQFRTIAMDYWASLEHALRYKAGLPDAKLAEHSQTLLDCARSLQNIEAQMQGIHRDINGAPRVEEAPNSRV